LRRDKRWWQLSGNMVGNNTALPVLPRRGVLLRKSAARGQKALAAEWTSS
jgi:hypothetical protein